MVAPHITKLEKVVQFEMTQLKKLLKIVKSKKEIGTKKNSSKNQKNLCSRMFAAVAAHSNKGYHLLMAVKLECCVFQLD